MSAATWTNRHGQPTRLARSMHAPFVVIENGIEVADYGTNEQAAAAHYDRLVLADREARGIVPFVVFGSSAARRVAA